MTLSLITLNAPITDEHGCPTEFFLLRWQELLNGSVTVPTANSVSASAQTDAIATASVFTVLASGVYRVSYYLRKTIADGVSSSLQFTWGWTDQGAALTESAAALTTDTATAEQSGSTVVSADASSDLTIAVSYASNTPNRMTYNLVVVVERLA